MVNKGDLNKADHLAVEKRPEAPAVDQDIGADQDQADTHAEKDDQLVSPESWHLLARLTGGRPIRKGLPTVVDSSLAPGRDAGGDGPPGRWRSLQRG